jgi:O-antigen ligase
VFLTLPAFGVYANAFLRYRKYKLEVFLFFLAYILADSSLGFLGILLTAFFGLLPRLNIWKMMGFGFAALGGLAGLFFASENFRIRVADTAIAIARMNFSQANASTFALLSNAYVTIQTFLDHPLIGIGIGGYQYAYTKYVPFISANTADPDLVNLNMFDASSMFLRATAELGLVGLVSLLGFLIVCSRVRGDQHVDIRNALLPYLLIRMLRYGAWFSLELYFFVGLFVLNYLHSRARYNTGKAQPQANPL